MTREEGIEKFEIWINSYYDKNKLPATGYIQMAVEALRKQIPQTAIIENGFVKCPACKRYIRYPIIERYNNCPECGQALKWEGEDDTRADK